MACYVPMFPVAQVFQSAMIGSDHSPLILNSRVPERSQESSSSNQCGLQVLIVSKLFKIVGTRSFRDLLCLYGIIKSESPSKDS